LNYTFEFELDEGEQVRASRVVAFRRRAMKATLAVFAAIAILATLAFVSGLIESVFVLVLGWGCLVGGLAGAYAAPKSAVKSLRKNNRAVAGPHTYVITPDGLDMRSLGATSTLQWANVFEVYESREFLFFYFAAQWAQVLPKRVIPAETLVPLRSAIQGWAGARAHLVT